MMVSINLLCGSFMVACVRSPFVSVHVFFLVPHWFSVLILQCLVHSNVAVCDLKLSNRVFLSGLLSWMICSAAVFKQQRFALILRSIVSINPWQHFDFIQQWSRQTCWASRKTCWASRQSCNEEDTTACEGCRQAQEVIRADQALFLHKMQQICCFWHDGFN